MLSCSNPWRQLSVRTATTNTYSRAYRAELLAVRPCGISSRNISPREADVPQQNAKLRIPSAPSYARDAAALKDALSQALRLPAESNLAVNRSSPMRGDRTPAHPRAPRLGVAPESQPNSLLLSGISSRWPACVSRLEKLSRAPTLPMLFESRCAQQGLI